MVAPIVQNRSKSGDGTPHSLTEFISKDIDELFREAGEEEFGSCRKEILTALVCRPGSLYDTLLRPDAMHIGVQTRWLLLPIY